ncbi:AMP-binding enzyme [Knoellia sp. Soil729]|uniref:AMP-binding enzyme n=1 Tax=Knoellia sp. Soil729 TaxID=1736394 RepID=UPI001F2B2617|nr:hypothetical protein [Knoellia sp. Soil729]
MAHPGVRDCAVVGLADGKWVERVVAVVQAQPDAELEPADGIAFVKQRLGSVKAPKDVWVCEHLPRSKVGKVLKSEIKTTLTT